MGRSIRFLSVAALVAAPLVFGVAAPAGARSAAPRFTASRSTGVAPTPPNSNLGGKGAKAKFKPAKLTATVFAKKKTCNNQANISFTVTNPTKQSYNVTFGGSPAFTLPGQTIENICVFGPPGTFVLGLQGSAHTLKVTLLAD